MEIGVSGARPRRNHRPDKDTYRFRAGKSLSLSKEFFGEAEDNRAEE